MRYFTRHRGTAPPPAVDPTSWVSVFTLASTLATPMLSVDPLRLRLAATTQRPAATCVVADPIHVTGTVLIAPPQGGGPDPNASPPGSAELWAADAHFTAAVRVQGAGFVDRRPFLDGDETALTVRGEGSSATWTVAEGVLAANGTGLSVAEFGDSDWDHLTMTVGLVPGASRSGVGFALPATGIAGALFAVVVEGQGEPPQLLIGRGNAFGGIDPLGTLPLPAAAPGANAPIALIATMFDDRLRATVGDAVLEADRGDTPSGPAALVADGPAAFSSLQVQGLDLYAFPFAVSRFRSFAEHVGSWPGRLDTTTADALGAGTSGETVSGLWTATAAAIAAAMSPDAASADRDRVFSAWVTGLGLPLKDELAALELTRVVDAGRTSALVIESPEPIDFTAEVTVALKRRIPQRPGGVRPPVGPPVNVAASDAVPERPIRDRLESLALAPPPAEAATAATGTGPGMRPRGLGGGVLQPRGGVLQPPGGGVLQPRGGVLQPPGGGAPPPRSVILDVTPVGPNLALKLAPALGQAGRLSVIAVEGPTRILYSGLVRPGLFRGQPATMPAERVGLLEAPPPGSELIAALAHGAPREVFLASSDLMRLLGWWQPSGPAFVDVPVQVLQSGDARRAIVVPVAGAQATPLPPGSYQMTLALVRKRWQTTDPAGAPNTYQSSATLLLEL